MNDDDGGGGDDDRDGFGCDVLVDWKVDKVGNAYWHNSYSVRNCDDLYCVQMLLVLLVLRYLRQELLSLERRSDL